MKKIIVFAIAGILFLASPAHGQIENIPGAPSPAEPSLPQPAPSNQPQPPQPEFSPSKPGSPYRESEEVKEEEYFAGHVDPEEIQNVLRQFKEIQREAKRVLSKAKKIAGSEGAVLKINEVLNHIAELEQTVRNSRGEDLRDALQNFYDSELWDTINEIRASIELPGEIKRIEKDLRRLEKLMNSKTFAVERVDMGVVRMRVEEIKGAINDAKAELAQGNFEEARDFLSVIYEGVGPGEIMGALSQLREISRQIKNLKPDLKESIYEILTPVLEAVDAGEFREANEIIGEVSQDLWRLISQVKSKRTLNDDLRRKIDQLEGKIQEKLNNLGGDQGEYYGPQSRLERYEPYKASFLENIYFTFLGLFD